MAHQAARSVWLALALLSLAGAGRAQYMAPTPINLVLVTTEFHTPLAYPAALAKISDFYEEQVGRKADAAFPEIAPRRHYDVWHDMWVAFGPDDAGLTVTMKRQADTVTNRIVKSWMMEIAGRLGATLPIPYRELPAPALSEADIYATPKDLAIILKSLPGMKAVPTWQHLGLAVNASPLLSIAMEPAGLHGIHHVRLLAENATGLRQLNAALAQGLQRSCICGVYSELAEVESEVGDDVKATTSMLGTHTSGTIFTPELTQKHEEDMVRARPEMKKRLTDAAGYFNVKFRPDKPYPRVTLAWTALQGYVRETGAFQGERQVGRIAVAAVRVPAPAAPPLNARMKMAPLPRGAYRIRLEADVPGGSPVKIDERLFWFDGKVFEEI